jgi:hypothetical protein
MARNWKRFIHGPKRRGPGVVHVTVNKKNNIYLNRHTWEQLGSPEAAILMLEEETDTIGIEPAHLQKEGAFPFKVAGRSMYMLNATTFFQNHGIRFSQSEAFLNPSFEDGILALNLRTTRRISAPKRTWKGKPIDRSSDGTTPLTDLA